MHRNAKSQVGDNLQGTTSQWIKVKTLWLRNKGQNSKYVSGHKPYLRKASQALL